MRRIPALVLTIAAIAAIVVFARTRPAGESAVFAEVRQPWMPAVSDGPSASNWFCPGVPGDGDGRGGEVVIANTTADVLRGRYSLLTPEGEAVSEQVRLEPYARTFVDIDEAVDATFASAAVELDQGGAVVEQRAVDPSGDTLTACSTVASAQWYAADGYTVDGSTDQLVLTNPYNSAAVVSLSIVTDDGTQEPSEYQGFPVEARSVAVVDVAELGAQSESIVGVSATTSRGRVVLGRSQLFDSDERGGYSMRLGAPTLADQWWFSIGQQAEGVTEEYRILNPTESSVELTAAVLGIEQSAEFPGVATIEVPAGAVETFAAADIEGLPAGPHSVVFSTVEQPGVVIERVLTQTGVQGPATSVSVGGLVRPDGFVANNWYVGTSPLGATEEAIVVVNFVNAEANVSVRVLGPNGFEAAPGLEDIRISPGGRAAVDLTDDAVLGQTLLVTSDRQVFVERQIPRDGPLGGTSTAWAVPFDAPA